MLKYALSLGLIYSILFVTLASPARAQMQQPPAQLQTTNQISSENIKPAPDLKKVFDQESAEFKTETARFDPVKTDRENSRQQTQKPGWSTTKKTLVITAIAVGLAAVIFLAVKYGKKCLRYSDDCTYNPDTGLEDCPCEEYEQRNP